MISFQYSSLPNRLPVTKRNIGINAMVAVDYENRNRLLIGDTRAFSVSQREISNGSEREIIIYVINRGHS